MSEPTNASGRPILAVLLSLLVAGFLFSPPGAGATRYEGSKPKAWQAEIVVRGKQIRSLHLVVPSSCRGQEKPSKLEVNLKSKIRLRKHGGFYRESVTRWSKSVLKGRLTENRIQGSLWFADRGDYVQCWTGTGDKPRWVRFAARKVTPQ